MRHQVATAHAHSGCVSGRIGSRRRRYDTEIGAVRRAQAARHAHTHGALSGFRRAPPAARPPTPLTRVLEGLDAPRAAPGARARPQHAALALVPRRSARPAAVRLALPRSPYGGLHGRRAAPWAREHA